MTRRPRAAAALLAAAVLSGAACAAVTFHPFDLLMLRNAGGARLPLWALAWLLAAAALVLFRPRLRVAAAAVVAALPVFYLSGFTVLLGAEPGVVRREWAAGGGVVRLVETPMVIDVAWEVRVETDDGWLPARDRLLWRGNVDRDPPLVRVSSDTVEITDADGRVHVVSFR
jgi:hypothetical protein